MLADLNALLDYPTHSTERARITSPRRLLPRPKVPRIAYAIGGAGIAVAAVTVTVMFLMGSKTKQRSAQVTPAVADAGVQGAGGTTRDAHATLVQPGVETIKIKIVTDSPNAEVYRESVFIGKAPVELELVKNNKEVNVLAHLPGLEGTTVINPIERKDGTEAKIKLKKIKGPPKMIKKPGGTPPTGTTGWNPAAQSNWWRARAQSIRG